MSQSDLQESTGTQCPGCRKPMAPAIPHTILTDICTDRSCRTVLDWDGYVGHWTGIEPPETA
jgi:hypothetical protein